MNSRARWSMPVCLLLLAVLSSPVPTFAQTAAPAPDPTLLPVATTAQAPLVAPYTALNVPGIPAGFFYLDPTTGVKIYKLTSSAFPTSGASFGHDYFEGNYEVSLPYTGDGVTRAVLVKGSNAFH